MEKKYSAFKSDRFDVEHISSLSFFLYPNSIFVFAKDINQTTVGIHAYKNINWEHLDSILSSDPMLQNDVPTTVFVHQKEFVLVPGVLYMPGKEEEYLKFVKKSETSQSYFNTSLDSNNIQIISAISTKLKNILAVRFSELTLHHGGSSFLSYLFKERFNLIDQEILLNVYGQQMYLAAFHNQELVLFNTFDIQSNEDILKYTLIVIKQLNFERNLLRVSLYGANSTNKITEEWGQEYFKNFRLLKPHSNQTYTHGFKNLKSIHLFETNWQFD